MTPAATTTRPIEPIVSTLAIDEIPTHPSATKAVVVSTASAMLALLGLGFWYYGPGAYEVLLESNASVNIQLENSGYGHPLSLVFHVFGFVGVLCGAAGLLSLVRIRATYELLRGVLFLVYPAVLGYAVLVWLAVFDLVSAKIELDGMKPNGAAGVVTWWGFAWPALAVGLYTFWLHVMLWSRPVYAAFTRRAGSAMAGDRVLEDWRTHGRDPRARKSFYASFATHFAVLILIPFLMLGRGCVEAYRVPEGSGEPAVAEVKIIKKKKKKKTLTLRPNSAILFDIPDLDNLEVDKQMEELTQARYEVAANAKAGKLGKGGGKKGGWPEGMENYKIRFIRLDHGGSGWDDGMNQTDADINFLRHFAQATGFKKIASKGESHSVALLDKYPDDGFPPFVYMTGEGSIGRLSARDKKILREYCLKGGMLIGDAGSRSFGQHFRRLMREVFPDKQLLDIADDDLLYQLPYGFPNGAPAFWHHDGRRAQGIKHEGRWIVYYHPGDMNDAWKSPGYSDVTPEMKDAAMNLGVNLIYYSFNQWNDAVAQERK